MKTLIPTLLAVLSPALVHAEEAAVRISIAGSSTIEPVMQKAASAFARRNGGIGFDITTGGSHYGVVACGTGEAVLGMLTRELRDKELDLFPGLETTTVGYDGVVFLVGAKNPVYSLTTAQIKAIYTGHITNWTQLGGVDHEIVPYFQTLDHANSAVVGKQVGLAFGPGEPGYVHVRPRGDKEFTPHRVAALHGHEAVFMELRNDSHAIGFVSFGWAKEEIERSKGQHFKMIAIEGVKPSTEHIASNEYGIFRPLNLVTRGQPEGHAARFIEFLDSREGHGYIEAAGFIAAP